jgi:hypothetical protein
MCFRFVWSKCMRSPFHLLESILHMIQIFVCTLSVANERAKPFSNLLFSACTAVILLTNNSTGYAACFVYLKLSRCLYARIQYAHIVESCWLYYAFISIEIYCTIDTELACSQLNMHIMHTHVMFDAIHSSNNSGRLWRTTSFCVCGHSLSSLLSFYDRWSMGNAESKVIAHLDLTISNQTSSPSSKLSSWTNSPTSMSSSSHPIQISFNIPTKTNNQLSSSDYSSSCSQTIGSATHRDQTTQIDHGNVNFS